ncbi:hypothetical protein ACFQER_07955 [Halomicroarcula sp. GCM10025894]|uniref:hypothetical protein n=1 Tax=Halomicroarcula sp. GCM10025894 TaxID=3252673 RepID=UPI00362402F1
MDEKTEQLRDIFMDVSDEASVTESQAAGRGSLTDTDEATVEERLGETVARMRERYDFRTALDDPALVGLVRGSTRATRTRRLPRNSVWTSRRSSKPGSTCISCGRPTTTPTST